MQLLAIVLSSVAAAIVYGVIHDQLTARLSLDYFTVAHPRLFASDSPTLHAAAWGVLATWWVGLALGVLLGAASRIGAAPKLTSRQVLPLILGVMIVSACCAVAAGGAAWILASAGLVHLDAFWVARVAPDQHLGFLIASWVHLASYLAGAGAGLWACIRAVLMRRGASQPRSSA